MKRLALFAATFAGAVLLTSPSAAQQRPLSDPVVAAPNPEALFTSKDPKLNRNKQAALHIEKELLQCNQWTRAGEWLTDKYIQHNPMAASGLAGVKHFFIDIAKRPQTPTCDKLTVPVVAVQAEGDYVTVLVVRDYPLPGAPGQTYTSTWFDTWRFVDGKADEHWDPATLPPAPPPQAAAASITTGAAALVEPDRQADRDAIEALQWRYDRALDKFNADAYAALYTEDGSFGQVKGRDALRKMMSGFTGPRPAAAGQAASAAPAGPPHLQHATSNDWIEFTGPDSATIHYYWQTYSLGSGKLDDPPKLLAAGNGVDHVVQQNGQWLFQSRQVTAPED